jgi:tetratricopeptide (TPR) repeat protein
MPTSASDRETGPLGNHPTDTIPGKDLTPGQAEAVDPELTLDGRAPAADGKRFHLLRLHDRGGLGEVYVALDRELNREVALRRIKVEHADNLQGQARFVVEAEITGNLEHPGVVPIYSLGHDDSGRPYYAMRFIKGDKYSEALPVEARAVDEITAILGPNSFRTLFMTNNLGAALEGTGRLDEAEATLRKSLELRRKIHGDLNSNTQRTIAFLARLLTRRSNPEAAELFRELILLRRGRKVFDAALDRDLDRIRDVLAETAPPSISEPILRELIAALERAFWPGDWCTAHARSLLGGCLLRQGRTSDAGPILRKSLEVMEAARITPAPLLDQARKRFALLGAAPTQGH